MFVFLMQPTFIHRFLTKKGIDLKWYHNILDIDIDNLLTYKTPRVEVKIRAFCFRVFGSQLSIRPTKLFSGEYNPCICKRFELFYDLFQASSKNYIIAENEVIDLLNNAQNFNIIFFYCLVMSSLAGR